MKKIYIITTAHPYSDGRVTHRIAKSFIENGFDVTWFGPYPKGIFKEINGIKFIFYKENKNKFDRLIAGYRLKSLLKNQCPADIYFAVDPDSARVANFYAKKFKTRSVFDIHEIFHKDMLYNHVPGFLVPLVGQIIKIQMKMVCRKASLIIGVGETRINPFKSIAKRSMIIRHCVPINYVKDIKAIPFSSENGEVRIMQGKISHEQGTLKLLAAAKMATKILGINIKIVVFSIFSKDLSKEIFEKFIKDNTLEDNLILLNPVSFNKMFEILSRYDIGAISYQRTMGIECMPNRVFEYMSVGMPVLVPNYSIEMMRILTEYNCGIGVDMENIDEIVKGICTLVKNPINSIELGENGRKAFEIDCNWEQESRKLMEWIRD